MSSLVKTITVIWISFIVVWILSFFLGYGLLFPFWNDKSIDYPEFLEAVPVLITVLVFVIALAATGGLLYKKYLSK